MGKISVRKRGNTYYYSFEATEYTMDGKRKRIEKGGFASKKEAMEAGTTAKASLQKGNIALLSERVTLRDFIDEWLDLKAKNVKPTSLNGYKSHIKPILDLMGDKVLQKLKPRDVNAVMVELANKGYARRTLHEGLAVLRDALSYAVFPQELIQVNPAQYIKVPKFAPDTVIERVIIRQDKLDELLTAYPIGHPYYMPIVIAYHTGMRLGETVGLTWEAVDFAKGTITVCRQIVYTPATGYIFQSPKTTTSNRVILIDDELKAILRRHKKQQIADELKNGEGYFHTYEGQNGGVWQISKGETVGENMTRRQLVCTDNTGRMVSKGSISQALKKHGVNFHSLRHTHATLCAENGANPKGLAGRLGHRNINITANLYTHETESMQEQTKNAFLSAINPQKTKNVGKSVGKKE